MRRPALPREIFLSHSSRDHASASRVAAQLREDHGLKVWFSPANLRGAQAWHDEIGKALARCNWMVLLLTPSAVKSPWVKRELVYALSEKRYQNHIVPVLLRTCRLDSLSWVLRTIEHLDVRKRPVDLAPRLAAIWTAPS